MKHLVKRCLSMLVVLALCLSMLPAIRLTADAVTSTSDYVTNSSGYIYNWGKRGTTATYLSPNAQAFYSDNNVTYAQLAALAGSSTISNVPSSALFAQLHDLMDSNHKKTTSYDETRTMYQYTDCQESGKGETGTKISSFYSGKSIGPAWDSGDTWNREHTWPKSKCAAGESSTAATDIMMLRPTASSENSSRGHKAYGTVTNETYYNPNIASYNLHGDVARIMLYEYVRWEETENMWGASGVMESLDVLLDWMEEDPVDTWELGRNDSVESITGTRNVFVDYPELAFLLFNEEIPADYTTPSGKGASSAYTITAVSNNNSFGAVSLSGRIINAFPNTGYEVEGYTVINGTATVAQNGNAFTVSATSDCTVQINFKARTTVSGLFYENGAATTTLSLYAGDLFQLPDATNATPEGFTFLGWLTSTLEETDVVPNILGVGSNYTMDATTQFYAVYSRIVADDSSTSQVFNLYTGPITEGDYLLTFNNGAMKASVTSNRFDYDGVEPIEGVIMNPDGSLIWTLETTGDGYYTLYNEATSSYAGGNGTKSQGKLHSSVTDNYTKWSVSGSETYLLENLGNKTKGVNYTLRRNGNYGFACYAAATGGDLTLYKRAEGTVYYSTSATACAHADTVAVEAQAPTCTDIGYTAGTYCNDCSSYIDGHTVVEALEHDYEAVVTAPTVTEQGYTTHTCANCGDSYVDSYTEALGDSYTVSFVVPAGIAAIEDMTCNSAGIILPEAGSPDDIYTFVGWATESISKTETEPTLYTGEYVAEGDITLYAVYSYTVGGTGSWSMVTDVADLAVGMEVIIAAKDFNFAMSTTQNGNNRAQAAIVKDGSTITFGNDVQILTLEEGTSAGSYAFQTGSGYLYAASTSSNHLKTQTTKSANGSFTIAIASTGVATIKSVGNTSRGWMRYNSSNNPPLFSCYGSGQEDICLYAVSGSTVYISDPTVCEHANAQEVPAVDPTCTEPGSTAGEYCPDCETYLSGCEAIPALGHDYESVVTEPTVTEGGYTTHTCTVCGDSYVDSYTDAIGQTYTISFAVPEGVAAIAPMGCNNAGIKLPAAGVPEGGEYEYTFIGWATAPAEDTETAPEVYGANTRFYNSGADQTLYAVYSYVVGGGAGGDFVLVKSTSQLSAGAQVVIATNAQGFVAGNVSSQYLTNVAASFSGDKSTITTLPSGALVFTLGGSEGAWTFAYNGKLLGATAVKKVALGSGTTNWSISVAANGDATIQSATSSYGRFLYNVSSPRFTTYTSATSKTMVLPQLYVQETSSSTMYYTSLGATAEEECIHEMQYVTGVAATCYAEGIVAHYVCQNCEGIFADEAGAEELTTVVAPKIDHNLVGDLCTMCQVVGDEEAYYSSLADAMAETGSDYLFLNFDITEDVVVDYDMILDLNGNTLTGNIVIKDGATLSVFDSATADYTAENRGKIVGKIEGALIRAFNTPAAYGHNYKYLVIQESDGSYSAHRIYLAVKSVTLAPYAKDGDAEVSAIRYNTVFKCSDLVASYVTAYGAQFAGDTTVAAAYEGYKLVGGTNAGTAQLVNTLSTANTDEVNAANALSAPAVSAYITLTDGTTVNSASVSKSLQDLVVYANGLEDLTDIQKSALGAMYAMFQTVMDAWEVDIANIKAYGESWL